MDPRLAEAYGTNAPDEADLEKLAAAELAEQLAGDGEVNLENLDADALEALAAEVLSEGEPPAEGANDGNGEAQPDEEQVKMAEADFLGRVMAHSMVQELKEIEKTAAGQTGEGHEVGLKHTLKGFGEKAKGVGAKGLEHVKNNKGKYGLGAGVLAAGAGAAALHHKNKQSSALETLVEQRAMELLAENGIELEKDAGAKDVAGRVGHALKSGGKRFGELLKGGKKGEMGEMAGRRAGNSVKGAKQMTREALKSHGARAATAAGAGAAAYGGKKAMEKRSSALETLIEQRANEILTENGVELDENGQVKTSAAGDQGAQLDVLAQVVDQQAVALLEANGFEFEE